VSSRIMVKNFQHDLRHNFDNDECAILHKWNSMRGFWVLCLNGTQISKREGSANDRMLQVSYATSVHLSFVTVHCSDLVWRILRGCKRAGSCLRYRNVAPVGR
jgi:hypothetical protein